MKGLSFQVQKQIQQGSPNRMDIACFVGLVDLRQDSPRADVDSWLYQQSWLNSDNGYAATWHRESARELLDVPVPVESWERFDQLFAWETRDMGDGIQGATYLGTAVRSFFAQGGRFCYVVRIADSTAFNTDFADRQAFLGQLIPGYPATLSSHPSDRESWHGVAHLFGLPDVSMLCIPDLPDLVKMDKADIDHVQPVLPAQPEQFVECSESSINTITDTSLKGLPAPATEDAGYQQWFAAIHCVAQFIAQHRREVQLIASIPLPYTGHDANADLLVYMHDQSWFDDNLNSADSLSSSFVQLCYPWLLTSASSMLPQHHEPPDGALAGMMARNALNRGAYRTVSGLPQDDIQGLFPLLSRQQMYAPFDKAAESASPKAALIDRVSLFGFSLQGVSLLSDVTTSNLAIHRPANINRIISMIIRLLQQAGEDFVFENNGETLWAEISQRLNEVFRLLYERGALRGKEPEDAFYVRCDRSTMTQQDLDSGRVMVEVHFDPATSIESIQVLLSMQQNGSVSLSSLGIQKAVA